MSNCPDMKGRIMARVRAIDVGVVFTALDVQLMFDRANGKYPDLQQINAILRFQPDVEHLPRPNNHKLQEWRRIA